LFFDMPPLWGWRGNWRLRCANRAARLNHCAACLGNGVPR